MAYLTLSTFLIVYALFSLFIRNHLHLSEPPLAVIYGIILGPAVLQWIIPRKWGLQDDIMQEITRIIVGVQCFAVGIELPKFYFKRHWKSVLWFLGPIMLVSWIVTSLFAGLIFQTSIPTAMIIGACLSPTDPVLAASVLANSRFSQRVPRRLKHLLSAESACNDGVSFPFLYAGLMALKFPGFRTALKEWFLITVLWQVRLILTLTSINYKSRALGICRESGSSRICPNMSGIESSAPHFLKHLLKVHPDLPTVHIWTLHWGTHWALCQQSP